MVCGQFLQRCGLAGDAAARGELPEDAFDDDKLGENENRIELDEGEDQSIVIDDLPDRRAIRLRLAERDPC
jgi:hypothetical protein